MVASRKRQSKTANTPILVISAYNLPKYENDVTLQEIDNIFREHNITHRYAFNQGYMPNETLLQSLNTYFKMDGFADLSLNEYLRGLYGY